MANKLYVKEGMNLEGISMQEGKPSSTLKLLGFMITTIIVLGLLIFTASSIFSGKEKPSNDVPGVTILPTPVREITITPVITSAVTSAMTPQVTGRVTPTSVKKISPTIEPTVSTKSSALKLEILNGSGIKGSAGKMSTLLTSAGYVVVNTGNADAFTYKGINVNIKKSKATSLNQLKKDLTANNYLVSDSKTTLPETSNADAQIIIGTE